MVPWDICIMQYVYIYIYTNDIVLPEIGDLTNLTPVYSRLWNIMFNIVKNHDMGPGTAIVRAAGADIFRPCLMTPEGFFGHVSPLRKIHRPTNSCRITTHKWKNQLCFRNLLGVWRMVDVFLLP